MTGTATDSIPPVVFDSLEVGPVKVEARRISAPYRLSYGDTRDSVDLIYTYEEDVFDPNDPVSRNMAAVITAQVALNYGLFCKKMVFHDVLDDADRRLIKDMAENTAREIYVKKFLEENPFLIGEAARLEPVKKNRYLAAELVFSRVSQKSNQLKWRLWQSDHRRHAVLSSGGKDSLLSFGLLTEAGYETHSIFINESGRHWFTALNAYDYFKKNIPHTARVWTNSDRVFNWMLRHMPFITKNFSRIRSDEYPIRLWTVAVFLFGAVPLLRKRGIGRLLIGDEYDTTTRQSFKGITHYDGLYDQSRYFDNAMSRYFLRKGWNISQFSLLRPLSELLIQKILTARYPLLQEHQVSCHAAHKDKEQDRIRPCGQCEKCRRIVGMLKALGEDPTRCGYTREQIEDALRDIFEKGVHQESAGARQLMHMLAAKGLIDPSHHDRHKFKEQSEILKLRFDPERSPIDSIPIGLRNFVYPIFLEYADGAVQRSGRKWKAYDPLADPRLNRPYAFELGPAEGGPQGSSRDKKDHDERYKWGELTWIEARDKLQQVDIALLPVGAIEQHGPHLPLDTDAFDAGYLADRVADACSYPKPLVLPLIPYGVSYEHSDFKGTVSIDNDTLSRLVYDIGMSAAQNGIKKLVVINGHGGNGPALNHAAQMINRDARIFVCVDTGETSDVDIYRIAETPNDVHAGEIETSTALAVRPHLVKMELATRSIPRFSSRYLNFTSRRGVLWYAHTQNVSPNGVMGDATRADAAKGRRIWEMMIAHLVALVEDLKSMTLDEIHHNKY